MSVKNTAKTYCYEKAAPPDSALYYSLRKLNVQQREAVVAIHAFYREIEDIVFECQDHELALIKFNWWRSEVAKLTLDKPDHPVMVLLQNNLENLLPVQQRLLTIIDGFEQSFVFESFATFEDVVVHWMRTAGERELLINELLQNNEIVTAEIIYQLMLVIEIVHYLQHLRRYVRRGLIYFPVDELQQWGVTQTMLQEFVTTESIKKLLQHQAEKVARAYAVSKTLNGKQRAALSHLMIRSEIARTTLHEIQRSDFRVLENLIVLTPLRYWWIAQKREHF